MLPINCKILVQISVSFFARLSVIVFQVSPDCVNSESRSLRNAQVFLESCFTYFDVESRHLFQAEDLYNRTNLEKVGIILENCLKL